jgi:hypothetical protein
MLLDALDFRDCELRDPFCCRAVYSIELDLILARHRGELEAVKFHYAPGLTISKPSVSQADGLLCIMR